MRRFSMEDMKLRDQGAQNKVQGWNQSTKTTTHRAAINRLNLHALNTVDDIEIDRKGVGEIIQNQSNQQMVKYSSCDARP